MSLRVHNFKPNAERAGMYIGFKLLNRPSLSHLFVSSCGKCFSWWKVWTAGRTVQNADSSASFCIGSSTPLFCCKMQDLPRKNNSPDNKSDFPSPLGCDFMPWFPLQSLFLMKFHLKARRSQASNTDFHLYLLLIEISSDAQNLLQMTWYWASLQFQAEEHYSENVSQLVESCLVNFYPFYFIFYLWGKINLNELIFFMKWHNVSLLTFEIYSVFYWVMRFGNHWILLVCPVFVFFIKLVVLIYINKFN